MPLDEVSVHHRASPGRTAPEPESRNFHWQGGSPSVTYGEYTMAKFKMVLSYEAVVTLDIEAPDADTAFDIAHRHPLDTRHDDISFSQEPTNVDLIDS